MRRAALLLALLAAPAAALPAGAGPVADAGWEAERLAGQGKHAEAIDALEKARDQVWKQAPLAFEHVMFVASEPQGYGVYEPRPNATFKAGETMFVYGEPQGYGYGRQGDMRRIEFDVAISVVTSAGETVIKPQSGKLALASRAENKEYMVALSYEPKGLQPGDYVLQAEFKDVNSGKTGVMRLAFKVG